MKGEDIIYEIISKECERYDLESRQFIKDRQQAVERINHLTREFPSSNCSEEEFVQWKEDLLCRLYAENGYSKFYSEQCRNKNNYDLIRRLSYNIIEIIRKDEKELTIDAEMKIDKNRTVAFRLSKMIYSGLYKSIAETPQLFPTPGSVEMKCEAILKEIYPLQYKDLIERLEKKDNEFWAEIGIIISSFVKYIVTAMHKVNDSEYMIEEVTMNSILSINEQMDKGKFNLLESATHFLNSMRQTCRYKIREFFHSTSRSCENIIEDGSWNLLQEKMEDKDSQNIEQNIETDLLDIDINNHYEVGCVITQILLSKDTPLYNELVFDVRDKVDVLLMHYVEGLSYEDIAQKLADNGVKISVSTLRQQVKRVKESLRKRVKDIIIEKRRKNGN